MLGRQALYFGQAGSLSAAYPDLGAGTSAAIVPLHGDGRALGALALEFSGPHDFTDDERRFFQAVASQAVLALGRVTAVGELERRVLERTDHLETRTAQLEARTASLDAFIQFSELSATLACVRELAGHAVRVLRSTLGEVSVGYYEPEGRLLRAKIISEDVDLEVAAVLRAGIPVDAPSYAAAVDSRRPLFVPSWDAPKEGVADTEDYGVGAFYPLFVAGELRGLLAMGVRGRADWDERERSVFRAVGNSLNLALERAEAAEILHLCNAELNARTQALEGFAALTRGLALRGDPLVLARRALEVILSLLPAGYGLYYEQEAAEVESGAQESTVQQPGHWRSQVQIGDVGSPDLQAFIDAGPIIGQILTLDLPWQTREALYQDTYFKGQDTPSEMVQHVSTVASLPVLHGQPAGVLAVVLFDERAWTSTDRVVLETVVVSLEQALERSDQAHRLREQNAELAARSRALEGFVELTQNLPQIREPYALIRRAQEVLLSLLPPGYADFWEIEGERWVGRSQVGEVGNPGLQEVIGQGFPLGHTPSLDIPRATRQPHFQSAYVAGTDTVPGVAQHIHAVASVPLLVNGQVAGIVTVPLFEARSWSEVDRIVLTTVVQSLGISLERAESVTQLAQRSAELEKRGAALARSNEELQAANEELEAFSYSVLHDLRTPVRHIKGFSELARKALARPGLAAGRDAAAGAGAAPVGQPPVSQPPTSQSPGEQATEYMHVVEKAALRMSTLIDAMLDLSRTSRQEMRLGVVDLNLLAARAVEDVQPDILERALEWRVRTLPLVMGDRDSLQQVMTNLLSNAVKYSCTRAVAVIEVWAEQTRSEWSVHVRDNGVGFDANYQDKLFGVFQRLHSEREFEGTGIGLAMVRRIVLRHGGRVSARSGPGQTGLERGVQDQGATFSFTLPKPD